MTCNWLWVYNIQKEKFTTALQPSAWQPCYLVTVLLPTLKSIITGFHTNINILSNPPKAPEVYSWHFLYIYLNLDVAHCFKLSITMLQPGGCEVVLQGQQLVLLSGEWMSTEQSWCEIRLFYLLCISFKKKKKPSGRYSSGVFCLCTSEENKQNVVRRETALTFTFDSSIQRASRCELGRNTEREMRRDRASIQLMVLFCLQHISSVQAGKSLLITTSPIRPVVSVPTEARADRHRWY